MTTFAWRKMNTVFHGNPNRQEAKLKEAVSWAPLGGAQHAQFLAVAGGGSKKLCLGRQGCEAFCSFREMSSRIQSLQKDPRDTGLMAFATLSEASLQAKVLWLGRAELAAGSQRLQSTAAEARTASQSF